VQNRIEYFFFLLFSKVFCLVGIKRARKFAIILALLFYYIIPIRKKVVLENINRAFPTYSPRRIREIAFGSYKSFAITLTEILTVPILTKEEILRNLDCPNISLANELLSEEKGVILLTAHFGNWEYGGLGSSLLAKVPFYMVVKDQRNELVNEWMKKNREKWENKMVPLGISIRNVYQALKEKKLVGIALDQRGPAEGVRVNLFGIPSSVYTGPAVLHVKLGVPLIVGITVRQPDFTYKIILKQIDTDDLPESEEEKIQVISQRYTTVLEECIRENPEQWLWMHKRWKY